MQKVKVWDGFVRFYHWCQLVLLVALWWSIEQGFSDLHIGLGMVLSVLLVTRLVWGFVGSHSARFANFVGGPQSAFKEIRAEFKRQPKAHLGHSILGGYMAISLMLLIGVQLITGWFNSDDILSDGPLYSLVSEATSEQMSRIHEINFELLLGLSALHVFSILVFSIQKRGYFSAMLSGYKLCMSYQSEQMQVADTKRIFLLFVIFLSTVIFYFWPYFELALDTFS
ncbi:hydrogenase [Alginatibacterium sediminis]|uniref:Hydrogenase n=1 Tax=Alginatibacterium sediminis TaxID=2164068 RepID=A0A420EHE4_9ALTE|nr:cytochrome b/b6 domain-containing protein [Alginatibacterium sediminis]RKF20088.1 hydrogenase [Alginatibacterium sediminis]